MDCLAPLDGTFAAFIASRLAKAIYITWICKLQGALRNIRQKRRRKQFRWVSLNTGARYSF
ncbi:hypothetical protein NA56DRAFT_31759 [Hyaloscypha hepaticicola]|uniref:Uncharacterized protein n=1 Tax=Hyaloscypha hepaticicola TaxID=2082293 RepID=A0A2J6QDC1_9HELO|nr:hypothetical protein NA56DRAFT_31759 [Hyaloscypha hepaticicola]